MVPSQLPLGPMGTLEPHPRPPESEAEDAAWWWVLTSSPGILVRTTYGTTSLKVLQHQNHPGTFKTAFGLGLVPKVGFN